MHTAFSLPFFLLYLKMEANKMLLNIFQNHQMQLQELELCLKLNKLYGHITVTLWEHQSLFTL